MNILMGQNIFIVDGGYLIYGITISTTTSFRKMFLIEVDEQLNETSRHIFAHASNIYWAESPLINDAGNLVVMGGYNGLPSDNGFVGEYSLSGETVRIKDLDISGFANNILQLPDKSYLLYFSLITSTKVLSADWLTLSDYQEHAPVDFRTNDSYRLLTDTSWIMSGVSYIDDSGVDPFWTEQAYLFSTTGESTLIFEYTDPEKPGLMDGRYPLDYVDTSCIYLSNAHVGCTPFFYVNDSCFNYLSLHSFQLNGAVNWTKYIGFDAAYYPQKVLATRDSGVILLAYRYNEFDNPSSAEGDIYLVKFDKEGNYDLPVSTRNPMGIVIQQILVYPNPANEFLHYKFDLPNAQNLKIKLYDASGKLVLEDLITDKETRIDQLSTGNYFYQIWSEGALIQTGKLVVD